MRHTHMAAICGGRRRRHRDDLLSENLIFIKEVMRFDAIATPSPHQVRLGHAHCTTEGQLQACTPTLNYDNTCVVHSGETQIYLVYSDVASTQALELLVRLERALNVGLRGLLEAQIAGKLHKVARDHSLSRALEWSRAYTMAYDGRVFVSRRDLYTEWLQRQWLELQAWWRRQPQQTPNK